jgi:23S rRNA (adenine2503-C2)-methyltransferase
MSAPSRYGATLADLHTLVAELGEPAFRARQLHAGLWEGRRPLDDITELSKPLRAKVAELLPEVLVPIVERRSANDATIKWLWQAPGGDQVETVLMRSADRATVCVSSQAGCAMGCTFCATGQAGFERHLQADEIVEQVLRAQHATEQRVSNVVFMGMGEPLANLDEVETAIVRLHDDLGLSARKIVVSTVGVVPGMERLRDFALPVTLAVSLHAPDDALRDQLVPLNRRYPIAEVLDAARGYVLAKGRRVTFEYACIAGINDHPHLADALAGRLGGFPGGAHVNLIPLNATAGFPGRPPDAGRIAEFGERLRAGGVTATVRRNRGTDIDAACGQLRMRTAATPRARDSSS